MEAAYEYIVATTRENAQLVNKFSQKIDSPVDKDNSVSVHTYHKMKQIECLKAELRMVNSEREQILEQLKKNQISIKYK